MTVRFSAAWEAAQEIAGSICSTGIDVVLVRDILGRVSLVIDSPQTPLGLPEEIRNRTGNFCANSPVILNKDLFDPNSIIYANDLLVKNEASYGRGRLAILERTVVGADWTRSTSQRSTHRATLYAFKGGVGRSTATFMLAQHLAQQGKCVLVADLDLESPGIGAIAQTENDVSEHGIVDYLIESGVGNENGLELVSKSQIISTNRNGEVWLAAAAGRHDVDYISKLNRVYTDLDQLDFGQRLEAAVSACEAQVTEFSREPDVVLLDSRAGIHDIAAVALTRIGDLNLLFAVDNPQTWAGYGSLFRQWRKIRQTGELGFDLRMVAAMTPADDPEYLDRFRDNAQKCFAETLYEQADPGDLDAFNFDVSDDSAPHSPLSILFNSDLVTLDPARQRNWHSQKLVEASYKDFVTTASDLISGE